MAKHQPRIAVRVNGATHHYIGRAAALVIIASGWARWLDENRSVEMLARSTSCRTYIPQMLPAAELPGVRFQEPQSLTWREQHRQVVVNEHGYGAGDPRN